MPDEAVRAHRHRIHLTLELRSGAGHRIAGILTSGAAPDIGFDGWLELMRLLEDVTAAAAPHTDSTTPPTSFSEGLAAP